MSAESKFPNQLITSPIWGKDDYVQLEAPFVFISDVVGPITAEKGFDSDGASIPLPFRGIINPDGQLRYAAIPHDVLYWYRAVSSEKGARKVTRQEADSVIFEAMGVVGCSKLIKYLVYSQLRIWGWIAWEGNVKKKVIVDAGGAYVPVGRPS